MKQLAARDGGSARGTSAVMMRHGARLVSVGAVRPPVALAEPPSVAAGDSRGGYLPSVRTPAALPGHSRPGRRHIYSPAGYSHGLAPTGVKPPLAPGHRLSVARPSVIVSAQGNRVSFKERVLLVNDTAEEQPGGVGNRPAGRNAGRMDAEGRTRTMAACCRSQAGASSSASILLTIRGRA